MAGDPTCLRSHIHPHWMGYKWTRNGGRNLWAWTENCFCVKFIRRHPFGADKRWTCHSFRPRVIGKPRPAEPSLAVSNQPGHLLLQIRHIHDSGLLRWPPALGWKFMAQRPQRIVLKFGSSDSRPRHPAQATRRQAGVRRCGPIPAHARLR